MPLVTVITRTPGSGEALAGCLCGRPTGARTVVAATVVGMVRGARRRAPGGLGIFIGQHVRGDLQWVGPSTLDRLVGL